MILMLSQRWQRHADREAWIAHSSSDADRGMPTSGGFVLCQDAQVPMLSHGWQESVDTRAQLLHTCLLVIEPSQIIETSLPC